MTEGTAGAAAAKAQPAASIGGQRTSVARRPVRGGASSGGAAQSGPSSGRKGAANGILKFYTDDAPGLKVGPTTVLVMALVFMAIVCSLHIMGKFRSG
mmetsp:Transcript_25869/g.39350  ORF Transcript_25869/g.39350 Transcript_25869/m.39350 type:complete len:98 (+) Transcript_25869:96-389(+)|eukprot:CAMPEP_0194764826 /NCGR_PEP_ID=MMETSP0323_2-20130528/23831_1 /TAXON_ID=2866 ORGANISM="Crypthecodinium cohnii, Strain Seligo" /NCGR_SAMPLE_ID=MMETSP0323_2 /ASSEMBLY_ACC=CAM_ASM_000346 /LENGTH=97 /DNA_ID=CAMNT_0039692849 /DNA_START=75 /DNA_END=368 /DNA_ORIENTATION=+